MILFLLAVAGSALILTQSVIFAPLREWLSNMASPMEITDHGDYGSIVTVNRPVFAILSKLASCPMCAGFWLGLAWGAALFFPAALGFRGAATLLAYGPAGSIVSALGVALWLLLVEAHGTLGLWRYLNQPKDDP